MLSAAQLIGSMDDAFGDARQRTGALHAQMNALSAQLLRVRAEESEAYRRLAQVRLGLREDDPLIQGLVALDANVRDVKQRLEAGTAKVDAEVAGLENELQALRADRALAADAVERRRAAFDAAAEDTRQCLAATERYRRQQAAAQKAAETAAAAESKTRQAEADQREKGKPYEADALFQYLWARGYGTSAYTAGVLARMIDGWVARFIGYDKARAGFAMLNEIPRRLQEHARRQRANASAEAESLAAMERAALDEGDAATRHAELEQAEAKVDAVDDQIEAKSRAMVEAQERHARLLAGEDAANGAATAVIVEALRRQELTALRDQARRTAAPEDDAVVQELEALEAEERRIATALDQAKAEQERQRRELEEIEALRRDYRRRGYGRGTFDNAAGAMLGTMLGQVLGGAISRDVFWGELGRHHRPSQFPGDNWGGGWGGGGGGGWGGGDGGGGGGSDFDTGGGF